MSAARGGFTVSTAAGCCEPEPLGEAARHRKRGATLESAVRDAVVAELADVGYAAFTIESVAARAQTGKASIYRRWPTKQDLVIDAFCAMIGDSHDVADGFANSDVSTRDLLVQIGHGVLDVSRTAGEAFRAVACEVTRDPELAELVERRVHCPKRAMLVAVLRRGVERGEVRPEAACELFAEMLPAVLMHQMVLMNRPADKDLVVDVVDRLVMPLLRPV